MRNGQRSAANQTGHLLELDQRRRQLGKSLAGGLVAHVLRRSAAVAGAAAQTSLNCLFSHARTGSKSLATSGSSKYLPSAPPLRFCAAMLSGRGAGEPGANSQKNVRFAQAATLRCTGQPRAVQARQCGGAHAPADQGAVLARKTDERAVCMPANFWRTRGRKVRCGAAPSLRARACELDADQRHRACRAGGCGPARWRRWRQRGSAPFSGDMARCRKLSPGYVAGPKFAVGRCCTHDGRGATRSGAVIEQFGELVTLSGRQVLAGQRLLEKFKKKGKKSVDTGPAATSDLMGPADAPETENGIEERLMVSASVPVAPVEAPQQSGLRSLSPDAGCTPDSGLARK